MQILDRQSARRTRCGSIDAAYAAGQYDAASIPALVAPIEFTLRLDDYAALGGHMDHVQQLASLAADGYRRQKTQRHDEAPWPLTFHSRADRPS